MTLSMHTSIRDINTLLNLLTQWNVDGQRSKSRWDTMSLPRMRAQRSSGESREPMRAIGRIENLPPVLTISCLLALAFLAALGKLDHARCDSTHSDHWDERNSSLLCLPRGAFKGTAVVGWVAPFAYPGF